jgi:hypothetical protein
MKQGQFLWPCFAYVLILGVLLLPSLCTIGAPDDVISITIENSARGQATTRSKQTQRMPIYVGLLDDNGDLKRMIPYLQTDLEMSGQFRLVPERCLPPTKKEAITSLYKKGYLLALFISATPDGRGFEWRLYTTGQALMEKGKRLLKQGNDPALWAHLIAYDLWLALMGGPGPFTTTLCYSKRIPHPCYKWLYQLCVCDIQGNNERVIVSTPRISVAPYWNKSGVTVPSIIYSEFTDTNVRLMSANLQGKRRVVLDLDGTMAGVSFQAAEPHQTVSIVYGRSGGIWRYYYDKQAKKGIHIPVVQEKGTVCASPTVLAHHDIVYCAQGKIKYYHGRTGARTTLVEDGYNVGPACHEKSGNIVYSRRVKQKMQLFLYNMRTKRNEQLTYGPGDKTDPCWSPCGNWVAFGLEMQGTHSIMLLHIKTGRIVPLHHSREDCRYPTWSP